MRLRGVAILAAALALSACSPPQAKQAAAPTVTCADAPVPAGWSRAGELIDGVQLSGAGAQTAAITVKPAGEISGDFRASAQEQVAQGHWHAAGAGALHVPGYVTYEQSLGGVTLINLINETDDSHGTCGSGQCRIFVVLDERGVRLDMEMPEARAAALPATLRTLEPVIAHVAQYCQ